MAYGKAKPTASDEAEMKKDKKPETHGEMAKAGDVYSGPVRYSDQGAPRAGGATRWGTPKRSGPEPVR
jgi:hypothetical protein